MNTFLKNTIFFTPHYKNRFFKHNKNSNIVQCYYFPLYKHERPPVYFFDWVSKP